MKILIECPVCKAHDVELNIKKGIRATLNQIEKQIVVEAMQVAGGNRARAARMLKMPVYALRHLVEKHRIKSKTFS